MPKLETNCPGLSTSMVTVPSADDNPCWGGPEPHRHDLEHLLRVLTAGEKAEELGDCTKLGLTTRTSVVDAAGLRRVREKVVLYDDAEYLAINKPADLRMDGPSQATVHKLLLYLSPPPSVLRIMSEEGSATAECQVDSDDDRDFERARHHRQLLRAIAPLSNHAFLSDDPHRPAHQLDYATSGVLLIGKSRRASGAACRAFQARQARKHYVAVVVHPTPSAAESENPDPPLGPDFFARLPALPPSRLDAWEDGSLERRYRKKRQRDTETREGKRGTFAGYMPAHSVFDKWKATLRRQKRDEDARRNKEQGNVAGTPVTVAETTSKRKKCDRLPALPNPAVAPTARERDELLSLPSWKAVQSSSTRWAGVVETMAKEYNQLLADFYAKVPLNERDDSNHGAALPPLFRIQDENRCDEGGCPPAPSTFYMCASIAEPRDGRFFVVVDPSAVHENALPVAQVSSPLPDFRPALTKCTVLWRGHTASDGGSLLVAKVLLQPRTVRSCSTWVEIGLDPC